MSSTFDGEKAVEVVRAMFGAWMNRDLPTMRRYLSEDFIQWHSNIQIEFTLDQHQAILQRVLDTMRIEYHDFTIFPFEGGVLMNCLSDFLPNDAEGARDIPATMIFRLRDNLVYRSEEYVDARRLPDLSAVL